MPLRAIAPDGTSIIATDASPEEWARIKVEVRTARAAWRLPCCAAAPVAKTSSLGTPFFSHHTRNLCSWAPETAHHLALKAAAVNAARRQGWTVDTEVAGDTDGDTWVADVLARRGNARVAVEVQWSPIHEDELLRRQARYARAGIRGLWLIRSPNFPLSHALPAACVRETVSGYEAMLPAFEGRRRLEDAHEWQQRMPVDDFLAAAFGGRLQWGYHEGEALHYRLKTASTSCWACGAHTTLLMRVTVDMDGSEVDLELVDFDEAPDALLKLLPAEARAAIGIGTLRVRHSRTAGGDYLGNGCTHCDALQGMGYATHLLNTMRSTEQRMSVIDASWRKVLDEIAPSRWRVRPTATRRRIGPDAPDS